MRKLMILALMGIALFTNSVRAQKVYDYVSVNTQPSYPGGMEKFYSYLAKEMKYPKAAIENKTEGKVFASFIVEKDGQIGHVNITKGLSKETDNEAKRLLVNSPKWNPGLMKGKPVRVMYSIAVNFKLK